MCVPGHEVNVFSARNLSRKKKKVRNTHVVRETKMEIINVLQVEESPGGGRAAGELGDAWGLGKGQKEKM